MIVRTSKDLAHLIRDIRLSRALTQNELAARVGVSRKWIVDLEGGKKTTDLSLVLQTLRTLGLVLDIRPGESGNSNADYDVDHIIERSKRAGQ